MEGRSLSWVMPVCFGGSSAVPRRPLRLGPGGGRVARGPVSTRVQAAQSKTVSCQG